jgi:hypothetical protein
MASELGRTSNPCHLSETINKNRMDELESASVRCNNNDNIDDTYHVLLYTVKAS